MYYVHAEKVLPPALVRQIRKYCTGFVYVPVDRKFFKNRYRQVLSLHKKRLPTDEIARRVHLRRRRVQQIIREARWADGPKGRRSAK